MQNGHLHITVTTRVKDAAVSGWEFTCRQCGYRARYSMPVEGGQARLEILDLGDPQAHHTSEDAALAGEPAAWEEPIKNDLVEPEFDESWLSHDSRLWLEGLLERLD